MKADECADLRRCGTGSSVGSASLEDRRPVEATACVVRGRMRPVAWIDLFWQAGRCKMLSVCLIGAIWASAPSAVALAAELFIKDHPQLLRRTQVEWFRRVYAALRVDHVCLARPLCVLSIPGVHQGALPLDAGQYWPPRPISIVLRYVARLGDMCELSCPSNVWCKAAGVISGRPPRHRPACSRGSVEGQLLWRPWPRLPEKLTVSCQVLNAIWPDRANAQCQWFMSNGHGLADLRPVRVFPQPRLRRESKRYRDQLLGARRYRYGSGDIGGLMALYRRMTDPPVAPAGRRCRGFVSKANSLAVCAVPFPTRPQNVSDREMIS
ncbi:hypothetical protein FQR65_LT20986 [Abscondita terminalis]|nr:hypothetical protein FQR65_LT20986 [Abscondita terminalis]